jgi:alpha-D-ribose 1-methylphosphonate 5-triphosphate synthase subunit PhnI
VVSDFDLVFGIQERKAMKIPLTTKTRKGEDTKEERVS